MIILPAHTLADKLPTDLSALVFSQRPCIGQPVRLLAVGDLGWSGRVAITAARFGYAEVLREVTPLFQTGKIVFGNLEYPLLGNAHLGQMFAGNPQAAASLR